MIQRNIKSYMDTTHENMIWAVVNFALNPTNLPVTSSMAPFLGYVNGLQTNMNMVRTLRASIATTSVGVAADNQALKDLLCGMSANIMSATYSYAIDNSNLTLAAKMKVATSELRLMKIETFIGIVQDAVSLVNPLAGSLSAYGVTTVGVSTWQSLITQMSGNVANPKMAIAFRKGVNAQIQNLLKGNLNMLYNNCDRLALQLRDTNAAYYLNYKANRKLFPTTLSTQGRFTVKYYSGAPVTVGEIYIVGTDRNGVLDATGYVLVDHIPFGTHQVTLSLPTGDHTYGPFDFKKGKSLSLFFTISDPLVGPTVKVTEKDEVTK